MTDIHVIAVGAASGLGTGRAAYAVSPPGELPPSAIAYDPVLAAAGLARPFCARAGGEVGKRKDHASELLITALMQAWAQLVAQRPGVERERIGVVFGTSSGGMLTAESFFDALRRGDASRGEVARLARGATYFAPFDDALARLGVRPVRQQQVLAACASSTLAIGIGIRWLARGACDVVLAGGYDAVSVFVASGFEALRATSASRPRPFRLGRDGMALGEGAGVLALVREPLAAQVAFRVAGFGAACDAVHITAPDREGGGMTRAALAALEEDGAARREVGLVSVHGTATPYNDAMEARVLARLFAGESARPEPASRGPVVHGFKAQIGHTLGAAGVLEVLAAADALTRQLGPATPGDGPLDPEAPAFMLERSEPRSMAAALKLSAAFGGACAALVVRPATSAAGEDARTERSRPLRPVYLAGHALAPPVDRAWLAAELGMPLDRLARIDELGQLGLAATMALVRQLGRGALLGAGVVAGHALATLDVNARFYARLRERGARMVDPRLFPATSPNALAGHCAIAFGLGGPSFAVSSGPGGAIEALLAASELVAAGDAERMLVVAADHDGPVARAWCELLAPERPYARGAVALLLESERPNADAVSVDLDADVDHAAGPMGHLALVAWLGAHAGAAERGSGETPG